VTAAILVLAAIGIKAFYLLLIWLASAIAASELSKRKGYGEKWGLGTGLLTSFLGVIVWLIVPARPESPWKTRKARKEAAAELIEDR
jgi:type VI protein secretion system component VasK